MTKGWTKWDEFWYQWRRKWSNSRIGEFFYQWECRLFRHYNRVTARELPPTFHEPSALFPHIMFELLRIHIEEEHSAGFLNTPKVFKDALREYVTVKEDDVYKRSKDSYGLAELRSFRFYWKTDRELCDLYEWWTVTRPQRQKAMEKAMYAWNPDDHATDSYLDLANKLEDEYTAEETEMLIRLVKIRNAMWT